ncbi:stimulated by retinoic acid gene 6 protein-like [Clytia hemisphaerica]|uniref:stimulated by retinoic acid gene 6 protein-like n=1 Tax=Clytia hemisphaerica TaxID=252671 RepID=UPI0034D41CF8
MSCQSTAVSNTAVPVLAFLIPTLILIIMQIYSRVKKGKLTAQAPFLFLQDNDRNRLMTSLVFGHLSLRVFNMIFGDTDKTFEKALCSSISSGSAPEYNMCSFFSTILLATLNGFLAFPFFALISSPHLLVSSVVGIGFTVWEIIYLGLQFDYDDDCNLKATLQRNIAIILVPSFTFLAVILFGFGHRLYTCFKTGCYELPTNEKSVVDTHQILYLKNLLQRKNISNQSQLTLFQKLKNVFKPWFKFPGEILQCMSVIFVLLYLYLFKIQYQGLKLLETNPNTDIETVWYLGLAISIILYLVMVVHFLYCYQNDTLAIYTGNHNLYRKDDGCHNIALYHRLVFPAYLISAMLIGFLCCYVLVGIIVAIIYLLATRATGAQVLILLRYILSFVGTGIVFKIIQRLSIRYYFSDLESSKLQINLKHPRLFYVLSFFLFFVNVFTGLMSLVKRLLFIIFSFLLFYGRIDRNPMMFFKSMDISNSYSSFLRVENVFKNPIMRCFCQFLMEPHIRDISQLTSQQLTRNVWGSPLILGSDRSLQPITGSGKSGKVARNRWYVTYTLLRNPGLTNERYHGRHRDNSRIIPSENGSINA